MTPPSKAPRTGEFVAVPRAPTIQQMVAIDHVLDNHNERTLTGEIYAAALAAAPSTHVAVERTFLQKIENDLTLLRNTVRNTHIVVEIQDHIEMVRALVSPPTGKETSHD